MYMWVLIVGSNYTKFKYLIVISISSIEYMYIWIIIIKARGDIIKDWFQSSEECVTG